MAQRGTSGFRTDWLDCSSDWSDTKPSLEAASVPDEFDGQAEQPPEPQPFDGDSLNNRIARRTMTAAAHTTQATVATSCQSDEVTSVPLSHPFSDHFQSVTPAMLRMHSVGQPPRDSETIVSAHIVSVSRCDS